MLASLGLIPTTLLQQVGQSVIAGPYLQLGSKPGTIVVQMIQRKGGAISLTSSAGSVRALAAEPMKTQGLRMVKFAIDDLDRIKNFEYSVKVDGVTKKYKGQNTRSSVGLTKLAIFGDSGRGLPGQKLIAQQVGAYQPDFIVHVGDIVYPHGRESEYLKYFFPYYQSTLSRIPSVAVAGNHDTAYRDLKRYPDGLAYYSIWHTPKQKQSWAKDRGNYSFSYANSFWVILDSNTYNNWESSAAQEWLNAELSKGRKYPWRFVAFHHPPFHSSDKKKNEIHMRSIAAILEKNRVQAVFCGHVHNYQRAKPSETGPLYVVTGAGGAELYDQKIAKDRSKWKSFTQNYLTGYSFTTLEFDRNQAKIRQINTKGQTIDEVKLNR